MPRDGARPLLKLPVMKVPAILALLATMISASFPGVAAEAPFYVGCYTKPDGAKGIYHYKLNLENGQISGGTLVAEAKDPTFLAVHPNGDFLYAANEINGGAVSAYTIEADGTLKPINQQPAKGDGTCHLTVDGSGKFVLAANYGSGSIVALPLKENGALGEPSAFIQHTGSSANAARQKGPHAHAIYADANEKFVYACDLGLDKVLIYRLGEKGTLTPANPPHAELPPGSGPRHLAFHPNGGYAYVINEMLNTISVFKHDEETGALESIQLVSTLPADFKGNNSTAEIFVHPNGRFVYGSNRGHDSIAVFAVNEQTGQLKAIDHTPTGGKTPRNFAIDPTGMWLIAANQDTNNFGVFKIDPATGKLTATPHSVPLGAPVCVIFPPRN